ncbi:hypothetical protein [Paenisporosarcina cavernae]|uniref:hypothetical protein n=1 Tax=Paenisporosarcina cavernae TaxID=2320858 RepID=UPI0019693EFF|nr:hypothetical protein [Paenisporosarcina cavernae]
MVQQIECDCNERYGTDIDSYKLFEELKSFFDEQVKKNVFKDIPVTEPFYVGHSDVQDIRWYATKWYKCNVCGCLWEFDYPDFPAKGFVRKFENGLYLSDSR